MGCGVVGVSVVVGGAGEVRKYLCAKEESIFNVHPRMFEDMVCSIFKDLGWNARATAYSDDGGIDVILDGRGGATIGVQIKRYKRKRRIEADEIRSLPSHIRRVFQPLDEKQPTGYSPT